MSFHHNNILVVEDILDRNKELYSKGLEIDAKNRASNLELKEVVLELASNLETLIEKKVDEYAHIPINGILSAILSTFTRMGMSAHTINQIHAIFAPPEFDRYKLHVYNNAKKKEELRKVGEQLAQAEKHAVDSQVFDHLYFLESNIDHPKIKEFLEKQSNVIKKEQSQIRKQVEEADKVKMKVPPWGNRESETYFALQHFDRVIKDCADRVYVYAPKNQEDDQYYAKGIYALAKMFEPGTDLKYARDILSMIDIIREKYSQSVHAAKSRSKILAQPSKVWRGMTREQIGDKASEILMCAHEIICVAPGAFEFAIYLRDEQKPWVADKSVRLSPKLSESAFGGGSFVDDESIA